MKSSTVLFILFLLAGMGCKSKKTITLNGILGKDTVIHLQHTDLLPAEPVPTKQIIMETKPAVNYGFPVVKVGDIVNGTYIGYDVSVPLVTGTYNVFIDNTNTQP
jgi:hypothetical protein